jgi:hypothetical protein
MRSIIFLAAISVVCQAQADPWTITRTTQGSTGTSNDIFPSAEFNISIPLPGTDRWLLSNLDIFDANTLFVLNSSTAASYGLDWLAISNSWANPVNQSYFVRFTQGSALKSAPFFPGGVNVAAGTTLNSVDMRFSYTLTTGSSTPSMVFATTTQFHADGAPEPSSAMLVMVAISGLSLIRYHTPHPARKYISRS